MGKYKIIIFWSDEDQTFVAEVPELPGCMAHGNTHEEAIANAKAATQLWIAMAREFGDPIPEPKGHDVTNGTASSATTPRRWFYGAAAILMLVGVGTAFVQKGRESAVGQTGAKRAAAGVQETNPETRGSRSFEESGRWAIVSLAAVFWAMLSWMVALWRHEKYRGAWVVIVAFFALYVMLELMMV